MAPSKRVAIAGGKGGLGLHLVEGLLERGDALDVIILSRSASAPITAHGRSAPVIAVDYNDLGSIEAVLKEHRIDTIISALLAPPAELTKTQINLIQASMNVPSMRRFAPTEFGMGSEIAVSIGTYYECKRAVLKFLRESKAASKHNLEYTAFVCGIFMNYLGFDNPRPDKEKAYGHLAPTAAIYRFSQGKVVLPGNGEQKQFWSRGEDVGKFVAAACLLDSWPEVCSMAGGVATGNEIVQIYEKVSGKKLKVTYWAKEDIIAELQDLGNRTGPSGPDGNPDLYMDKTFRESQLAIINGELPERMVLNEITDVKPMGFEEYLRLWWGQ